MFEVGSKVIITESSHQKSIGPRRGSIGYVASYRDTVISPALPNICMSIGSVIFHRFGFEECTRSEAKSVIFVFPLIEIGKSEKAVTDLVSIISSKKNDNTFSAVRKDFGVDPSAPLVTAIPMICGNLTNCDNNELISWATSVLSDERFRMSLHNTTKTKHYENSRYKSVGSGSLLRSFMEMSGDKSLMKDILRDMSSVPKARETLVMDVRAVLSMILRHSFREESNLNARTMIDLTYNRAISRKLLYEILGGSVYAPHRFETTVSVYKETTNSPHLDLVLKEIEEAKATIVSRYKNMLVN